MNALQVDPTLTEKYDLAGPRYTSYPTAPHFKPWSSEEWLDALRENEAASTRPLSLYFHLPFCPSLCLYCGCNVIITKRRERIVEYLQYLEREMKLFRELVGSRRRVEQIHWGGGSPSYLTPDEIRWLGRIIRENFDVAPDAEIGVEIDPRRLTREHVEAFRDAGFNRASLGVQDFDPEVQKAINRIQPEAATLDAIAWCREYGIESINVDLIYGLPGQTPESFRRTLDRVIELDPDRIAVFNFAYVPNVKSHQKAIDATTLPERRVKMMLQKEVIETLTGAGYVYIGMDHFARPDDELATAQRKGELHRNFQGYATHAECDLIGFGITSISNLDRVYAQNLKTLPEYYAAIDEGRLPSALGVRLTDDDHLRRHVIMTLMCNLELSVPDVERRFGIDFREYFGRIDERLAPLAEDRLVELDRTSIRVTDRGRLFLRNVAMQFDAYLGKGAVMYSRTV